MKECFFQVCQKKNERKKEKYEFHTFDMNLKIKKRGKLIKHLISNMNSIQKIWKDPCVEILHTIISRKVVDVNDVVDSGLGIVDEIKTKKGHWKKFSEFFSNLQKELFGRNVVCNNFYRTIFSRIWYSTKVFEIGMWNVLSVVVKWWALNLRNFTSQNIDFVDCCIMIVKFLEDCWQWHLQETILVVSKCTLMWEIISISHKWFADDWEFQRKSVFQQFIQFIFVLSRYIFRCFKGNIFYILWYFFLNE